MTSIGTILDRSKALFLRYGVRSVTMDDVAAELGISKKTLYQHVRNKADLIDKITDEHIEFEKGCIDQFAEGTQNAIDELLRIAQHVVQMVGKMQPTLMYDLRKYYHATWKKIDAFHLGHVYRVMRDNLQRGMDEGLYRSDIDTDIIAKLYVFKTQLLTDEELFPHDSYDREMLVREYLRYHLYGILSETGLQWLKEHEGNHA